MTRLIINPWDKFNKLTVIKEVEQKWTKRFFLCKCDCWNEKVMWIWNMTSWHAKSCWCWREEQKRWPKPHLRKYENWIEWERIYWIYVWILQRCNNPKRKAYKHYWWRWIKCEWDSYEEFRRDMLPTYKEWLQIDRIDNDWNYSKENCRWSTAKENVNNRRNTKRYKWFTVAELAYIFWASINTLKCRIKRHWDPFYNIEFNLKPNKKWVNGSNFLKT